MKRFLIIVLMSLLAVASFAAGGMSDDPISGTWIGGSSSPDHQGYKYQYVFSPIGPDRWQLLAEGAYGPDTFGGVLQTFWSGEIRKLGTGYELRIMCLSTTDATEPPNVYPSIIAGRAILTLEGVDKIKLTYDAAGVWKWGTVPFVDAPTVWVYKPGSGGPTVEMLQRLKTDGQIKF